MTFNNYKIAHELYMSVFYHYGESLLLIKESRTLYIAAFHLLHKNADPEEVFKMYYVVEIQVINNDIFTD